MLWLSILQNRHHKIGHTGLTVKTYLDTDSHFRYPVRMHYAVGSYKIINCFQPALAGSSEYAPSSGSGCLTYIWLSDTCSTQGVTENKHGHKCKQTCQQAVPTALWRESNMHTVHTKHQSSKTPWLDLGGKTSGKTMQWQHQT